MRDPLTSAPPIDSQAPHPPPSTPTALSSSPSAPSRAANRPVTTSPLWSTSGHSQSSAPPLHCISSDVIYSNNFLFIDPRLKPTLPLGPASLANPGQQFHPHDTDDNPWRCPDPSCILGKFRECTPEWHIPVPARDWHVARAPDGSVHEPREASRFARLVARLPTRSVGIEGTASYRLLDIRPSWEPLSHFAPPASHLAERTALRARSRCKPFTSPLHHDHWDQALAAHPDRLAVALLLDTIRNGANVCYDGPREATAPLVNYSADPEHTAFLKKKLTEDIELGRTLGWSPTPLFTNCRFSPLFAVPKTRDGKVVGFRKIHDASAPKGHALNDGIRRLALKMLSWEAALDIVRTGGRGCFLIKRDIDAAFRRIRIRPQDQPLHGLCVDGQFACEVAIPFGTRTSPPIWDRVASKLAWVANQEGILVAYYVDDFLVVSPAAAKIEGARQTAARFDSKCAWLGTPIAADKSEGPATRLVFIGTGIDTETWTIYIPDSRKSELLSLLRQVRDSPTITPKIAQRLAGKLQFACRAAPGARAFTYSIYRAFPESAAPHQAFPVPPHVRMDIEWWLDFLPQWAGIGLIHEKEWISSATIQLETDSCNLGWGIYYQGQWARSEWTRELIVLATRTKRASMPFLELYPIVLAALTWGHLWSGKRILFVGDCRGVCQRLAKGFMKQPAMAGLLRVLADCAVRNHFEWRPFWTPGKTNTRADLLSRGDVQAFLATTPGASPTAIATKAEPTTSRYFGPCPSGSSTAPTPRAPGSPTPGSGRTGTPLLTSSSSTPINLRSTTPCSSSGT
jgi:hypothetical protein